MIPENLRFVFVKRVKKVNILPGQWVKSGPNFGIVTKDGKLLNLIALEVDLEEMVYLYVLKEKV